MGGFQYLVKCSLYLLIFLGPLFPLHASPPLSVYGQLPGFERAVISPSGERIALIGTVNGKRALLVLGKDRKPISKIAMSAAKVRGLYWAGESTLLLQMSNTAALGIGFTAEKAELQSMMVIPLDGDKPWSIFDKEKLIEGGIRGFYGVNERDGKWYGYFCGITLEPGSKSEPYLKSTQPVLYEVDLQTHQSKKIARRSDGNDSYRNWLIGQDGKVRVTFDFNSNNGAWSLRNDRGKEIGSGTNRLGNIGLIGFGATADTVIFKDQTPDTGSDRWIEVPIEGGPSKEILGDKNVAGSFFDNRTRQFIGYTLEGDTPSYHFFDAFHDKVIAATQKAFPGQRTELIDWNDKFDRLIVRTEGVNDPQTWWIVDIETGKADVLGTSYPIAGEDVAPVRMIHYKAGDGQDIAAVLTLPPGRSANKNLPVIIFPHGGPASRDYPGFDWWAQAFAARGYAVLQPNFRGSTGYGSDFEKAGHGEWGRKMQSDISDGLAYLVKEGIADPKRACIMGASYGGYAALAGITLQQGLYRCAVSVAGVSDVQKMVRSSITTSGQDRTLVRSLKDEIGSGRDLKLISPINYVQNVNVPVLLVHGKDDTVVPYEQSNDMAEALRKAGKTVEFVTLSGEDHWLSVSDTRLAMLQAAMTFMEKNNPPDTPK